MCQPHTANSDIVITLRGLKPRTRVLAQLKVPATAAECPIALEAIQDAEVDGLQGFLFNAAQPLHRELLLPCGHSFSASALIAHWLCHDMICPLCRAGCASPLRVQSLPVAWRERATAYVSARTRRSMVEDALVESAEAQFLHFALRITLFSLDPDESMSEIDRSCLLPLHPVDARSNTHIDMNSTVVQVSRAEMRNISASIQRSNAVGFRVALYVQAVGDMELLIDAERLVLLQSDIFLLPSVFWSELRAVEQVAANTVHHLEITQSARRVNGGVVPDARVVLHCTQHVEASSALDTVTGIRIEVPTLALLHIISDDEP